MRLSKLLRTAEKHKLSTAVRDNEKRSAEKRVFRTFINITKKNNTGYVSYRKQALQ